LIQELEQESPGSKTDLEKWRIPRLAAIKEASKKAGDFARRKIKR
jgi:hypothetical protein